MEAQLPSRSAASHPLSVDRPVPNEGAHAVSRQARCTRGATTTPFRRAHSRLTAALAFRMARASAGPPEVTARVVSASRSEAALASPAAQRSVSYWRDLFDGAGRLHDKSISKGRVSAITILTMIFRCVRWSVFCAQALPWLCCNIGLQRTLKTAVRKNCEGTFAGALSCRLLSSMSAV